MSDVTTATTATPANGDGTQIATETPNPVAPTQAAPNGATAPANQIGQDTPAIQPTSEQITQWLNDNTPKWLSGRLEQAKSSAIGDFLSELGLDNPDTLKTMVSEYQELKQAQMTESEKQAALEQQRQAEFTALQAERDTLKQEIEQAKQQALTAKRDSVILDAFPGNKYAKDLLRFVKDEHSADFAQLIGDDGTPNDEIKEKLVKAISEQRGELLRLSVNPGSPSVSNRGFTAQTLKKSPEELRQDLSNMQF